MKNKLKMLCEMPGLSSREQSVKSYIIDNNDHNLEMVSDNLGSVAFNQKGNGKKVAIVAHMDEVGFLVKHIANNGMLIVIPIGAVRETSRNMHKVTITTRQNQQYKGIVVNTDKLYIDLGLDSNEEVLERGINVGDMVTYDTVFTELSKQRYMAKALDNRLGCLVNLELMSQNIASKNDIFYAFTVMEEVGLRGAQTLMNVVKPDFAIIIDVSSARDEFDRSYTNNRQIGKGPSLLYYDKTMLPSISLLERLEEISQKYDIPIQKDMFVNGGTDGGAVHLYGSGIPTIVIAIPNRYGHGPYSIGDYKDLEDSILLIQKLLEEVDFNEI